MATMHNKNNTQNHVSPRTSKKQPLARDATSTKTDMDATLLSPDRSIAFFVSIARIRHTIGGKQLRRAYEKYGTNTKDEFTLCLAGVRGMCPAGEACRDIHVDFSVFGVDTRNWSMQDVTEFVPHSFTHSMANYANLPRHDASQRVPVYDHRSQQTTYVDSDSVIITAGSRGYFQSLLPNGDGERTEPRRMQQCTHFHKRICLRGPSCGFLHVQDYASFFDTPSPRECVLSAAGEDALAWA
eukprot:PhM_4_TR9388/c1_g1_i1/m.11321